LTLKEQGLKRLELLWFVTKEGEMEREEDKAAEEEEERERRG